MSLIITSKDFDMVERFNAAVAPDGPVALRLGQLEDAVLGELVQKPPRSLRISLIAAHVARLILLSHGRDLETASRLSIDFALMLRSYANEIRRT
jgi:hypothetical protein